LEIQGRIALGFTFCGHNFHRLRLVLREQAGALAGLRVQMFQIVGEGRNRSIFLFEVVQVAERRTEALAFVF
jgi:hypothetical protein